MAKVTVTKTCIVPKNKLRYEYADLIEEGTPVNAVLEAIRNKRIENLQAGKFTLTKTMVDDETDSTKVRIQTIDRKRRIWPIPRDHKLCRHNPARRGKRPTPPPRQSHLLRRVLQNRPRPRRKTKASSPRRGKRACGDAITGFCCRS